MIENQTPVINGKGDQERDFGHVSDVARASVLALDSGHGEILNIGSGKGTSVNSIVEALRDAVGFRGVVENGPAKQGEVYKIYLDASRARETLGWEPQVGPSRRVGRYSRASARARGGLSSARAQEGPFQNRATRMRLLLLSNYFPPHSFGGYELWCRDIAVALASRGHQVTVLTSSAEGPAAVANGSRFEVRRLLELEVRGGMADTLRRVWSRRERAARNAEAVRRTVGETKPDAAMIWGCGTCLARFPPRSRICCRGVRRISSATTGHLGAGLCATTEQPREAPAHGRSEAGGCRTGVVATESRRGASAPAIRASRMLQPLLARHPRRSRRTALERGCALWRHRRAGVLRAAR